MASYCQTEKEVDQKKDHLNNYFASIHKIQYCYWLREELRDILNTAGVKYFFGLTVESGGSHPPFRVNMIF